MIDTCSVIGKDPKVYFPLWSDHYCRRLLWTRTWYLRDLWPRNAGDWSSNENQFLSVERRPYGTVRLPALFDWHHLEMFLSWKTCDKALEVEPAFVWWAFNFLILLINFELSSKSKSREVHIIMYCLIDLLFIEAPVAVTLVIINLIDNYGRVYLI